MTSNCELIGKVRILPYIDLSEFDKLENNENAQIILKKIAEKVKQEESEIIHKKKYKPRKKPIFKSLLDINPNLFEELIQRNKSDYLSIIKDSLFFNINRLLEREVIEFICRRTLAFNKSREKISINEFVNGTISKTKKIITKSTTYSRTSIYEGIKLAKERKVIFTHQFQKGDSLWFFLNTPENQLILESIQAGNITETDLFILNEEKIKELRFKKKEDNNSKVFKTISEYPSFRNCISSIQNLNEGYSSEQPQNIENTTNSEVHITTIINNNKEKQHTADTYFENTYSDKEIEYINKLCNLKDPNGKNINFNKNQARELVKLKLDRSIFQVIDEKIELLFLEKNLSNSSWASILNNMIKEDRGGAEAYTKFLKDKEKSFIYEKYMNLIKIFDPTARTNFIDKERAIIFIKDKIETLYQLAINNKNLEIRDDILNKISILKKSCDLSKDLDFHIDDKKSVLYKIIQELKELS
ncbi:MAG: hypothetical protein U0354_15380 [Candidatus Sericytochromatia bacterium]